MRNGRTVYLFGQFVPEADIRVSVLDSALVLGEIPQPGDPGARFLRVIALAAVETIHNAFFDRRFRKDSP